MSSTSVLGSTLEFVRLGIATNWWGIGCPSHCGSSSFPLVVFALLFGLSTGILLGLGLAFWILALPSSVQPSSPEHPTSHLLLRRSRLRAYLNE